MWAARLVALGRGQDRTTRWAVVRHTPLACWLAWPPARREPEPVQKVSRCLCTLGIWTGSRKLHLSLFSENLLECSCLLFCFVLFCEAGFLCMNSLVTLKLQL